MINTHSVRPHKTPWIAFICSVFIPGFGQIYNQNYLFGSILIILEVLINTLGKINLSIYYSFNGEFLKSHEILNYQWALFYPCVYAFAQWHAYNEAININMQYNSGQVDSHKKNATHLNGLFIGLTVGFNLGLIWGFMGSPILGTLLGGMIGAIVGAVTEYIIIRHFRYKSSM